MVTPNAISLDSALAALAPSSTLWVALSGGLDSVALFHLSLDARARLVRQAGQAPRLCAIHVNHQLQDAAADFEAFCQKLCDAHQVPLSIVHVQIAESGQGPEAAAREARYRAFECCLNADDTLWLAQHADDQAETFVLNSMRASGVNGLAGMPQERRLGAGRLQRPLLGVERASLHALAQAKGWQWVEDPTNQQPVYARNRVRQRIIPALKQEWPNAVPRLANVAAQLADTRELLRQYAQEDLTRVQVADGQLDITALKALGQQRFSEVLRCYLDRQGLPLPPRARLNALWQQLDARRERISEVAWANVVARSWRGRLYLSLNKANAEPQPASEPDVGMRGMPVQPDTHCLALLHYWQPTRLEGPTPALECRPRQGGERLLRGGLHRRLKNLLQQHNVPPWQRNGLGIVVVRESAEVVAIVGEQWALAADGWRLREVTPSACP